MAEQKPKKIEEHKQFNLPGNKLEDRNVGIRNQDFQSSPNVLKTFKSIVVGNDKVVLDPDKGLFAGYLVRGINTTGYSTLTVFDSDLAGLHQIRTNLDVGDATIDMNSPGRAGQEIYLKIDNDTDANRTITFGSMFKVTGSLGGSTAASAILHFISNGVKFWEVSRTTGLDQ